MKSARGMLLAGALLLVVGACGSDDPVAPTMDTVAGAYTATGFDVGELDVLAAGGRLDLVLSDDGSVAGELVVPEAAGGPLQADMAGSYTLAGSSLTIEQEADTFVRDADWSWSDGRLTGVFVGGGGSVRVEMSR